jgi:hypothetical protein
MIFWLGAGLMDFQNILLVYLASVCCMHIPCSWGVGILLISGMISIVLLQTDLIYSLFYDNTSEWMAWLIQKLQTL